MDQKSFEKKKIKRAELEKEKENSLPTRSKRARGKERRGRGGRQKKKKIKRTSEALGKGAPNILPVVIVCWWLRKWRLGVTIPRLFVADEVFFL